MLKKFSLFISLAVLLLVSIFVFFLKEINENAPSMNGDQKPDDQTEENSGIDKENITIIDEIISLAKEGKIKELVITAGETDLNEVKKIYGEPNRIDQTSVGEYAVYQQPDVAIGFKENIAYDLRSYENYLQEITYTDILDYLEDPHYVTYYRDEENNHTILNYYLNDHYLLKWILDTRNKQLAPVHHISVVARKIKKQEQVADPLPISEQIEKMTVDEKIGQMIFAGLSGTNLHHEAEMMLRQIKPGGIILNKHNMVSPEQTIQFVNSLKYANKINSIPLFFGVDQEGGRIVKLPGDLQQIPSHLEIGAKNNSEFAFAIGQMLGKMVKAYGFNMNFAPVLDVNSNPDNPVIGDRSFGDEPVKVSRLGIETMKGIRSEQIISVIKHFPGHGDTAVDSHFELPVVKKSIDELRNLELIPFQNAIAEGADMVMIAHILLPEIDSQYPSSLSKIVVSEILRGELSFNGVVITDDITMDAITDNYDIGEAAVRSIQAGCDMIMVAHQFENIKEVFQAIQLAVKNGEISEERINRSVKRILELKEKYSLSDEQINYVNTSQLNEELNMILDNYLR